jgi:hypothetical protein
MKHKLATGILFVMAAATPWCQATTINFDNVASPTALSNQYAAQGVVFNQIEAAAQFATSVVPVSSPNYATPFYFGTGPRSLTFVDPSNPSNGAYADSVTITLNGYNNVGGWFSGATIDGIDPLGNGIAGQTQTMPPPTSRTGQYGRQLQRPDSGTTLHKYSKPKRPRNFPLRRPDVRAS